MFDGVCRVQPALVCRIGSGGGSRTIGFSGVGFPRATAGNGVLAGAVDRVEGGGADACVAAGAFVVGPEGAVVRGVAAASALPVAGCWLPAFALCASAGPPELAGELGASEGGLVAGRWPVDRSDGACPVPAPTVDGLADAADAVDVAVRAGGAAAFPDRRGDACSAPAAVSRTQSMTRRYGS